MTPPGTTASTAFEFFVEVSIIDQLVRTLMERRLPRGLSCGTAPSGGGDVGDG